MSEVLQRHAEAVAFAKEHMAECVNEILEWQRTSILRDGKVRQLAQLCNHGAGTGLSVAQSLVERAAYEFIDQLGYHS